MKTLYTQYQGSLIQAKNKLIRSIESKQVSIPNKD